MINATCQKAAFPMDGLLSNVMAHASMNLTKPDIVKGERHWLMMTIDDINRQFAGGPILTIPKVPCAAGHYPVLDNAVMHGFLHSATFAHRVCNAAATGFLKSIKKGGISATPEYVGQSAKSHFGHSFGFLRCSNLSFRPHASSTQEEKLAPGFSSFSRSTLASISAMSSCGKRIAFLSDLLFLFPVAIAGAHILLLGGYTPYNKKTLSKTIDVGAHQNVR